MMNYGQIYQGFGARSGVMAGRPAVGQASTPTAINATMTGSINAGQSGAPLALLVLATIGGLVVLYIGTRGIQGSRL